MPFDRPIPPPAGFTGRALRQPSLGHGSTNVDMTGERGRVGAIPCRHCVSILGALGKGAGGAGFPVDAGMAGEAVDFPAVFWARSYPNSPSALVSWHRGQVRSPS